MKKTLLLGCMLLISVLGVVHAEPKWMTSPATPTLPKSTESGYAEINGVKIWYAVYGHGKPVILLHGGLGNSNYWGNLVPVLAKDNQVIVMDSRGHGRSTRNSQAYSYDLMATDVIGLMDFLKIKKAAIVGWSDGAILGINIAIHHPERLTKVFAFAANTNPEGTKDPSASPVFNAYLIKAKSEYENLSATPTKFDEFVSQIQKMWATQPNITKEQLNSIKIPVWIVDGDHDEGIKRENTEFMAAQIPCSGLLILPEVSHFAMLQDPKMFNEDVVNFISNRSEVCEIKK